MRITESDRSYSFDPTQISVPVLDPSELEPGDVLCFAGLTRISNSIRFFDDCCFDHVALVEKVGVAENGAPAVQVIDVGFRGPKRYALEHYDDVPSAVLVRRHRMPGAPMPTVLTGAAVLTSTVDYGWEKILTTILVSLTRFSGRLAENADRWDNRYSLPEAEQSALENLVGKDARRFVANMQTLMGKMSESLDVEGEKRICSEFVAEAFDTFDEELRWYFGLVIPHRPIDGLLVWAAAGGAFVDHLYRGALNPEPSEAFDPDEMVSSIYKELGLDVTELPYGPQETLTDTDLRRIVVDSTRKVLRLLGWDPSPVLIDEPASPEALPAMALALLNAFMTERIIVSAHDITTTKSLVDVGLLDVSKVLWTWTGQ